MSLYQNRNIATCLVVYLLSSLYTTAIAADFLKIGVGARAIGMGSAYTAISGDVSSICWNPAGIATLSQKSISAMHTNWITDMSYDFAGMAMPFKKGVIGASVISLSQGNLEGWDENRQATGDFGASDLALTMSYAQKTQIYGRAVNAGVNFKVIRQQIANEQALGVACDLGLLTRMPGTPLNIGLSVQNIGPQMKFISEGYNLPLSATIGLGYSLGGMNLALDLKQLVYEGRSSVSLGTEYLLMNSFAIRGGYFKTLGAVSGVSNSITDTGIFSTNEEGLGMGFGLQMFGVNTDFSFTPYGDLGNTYRLSLSWKY